MKFRALLVACLQLRASGLAVRSENRIIEGCGLAPEYENAKPADYKDARKTFFNTTSKKTEPVHFVSGDVVKFECQRGFTTDGAKDGNKTFDAECTKNGYFKPQGVCVKASKCGALPNITSAMPTGKVTRGKVEFACTQGYSLDGQEVTKGGFGKNRFFELECLEFKGEYEAFEGECKPYKFVPAKETIRIYNKVSKVLFIVSCKGTLKKSFGKGETPSGLDNVCSTFEDSASACQGLVSKIKSDFTAKLSERENHDKEKKKDWFDEKSEDRPGIGDEAETFCTELWGLLEMPSL